MIRFAIKSALALGILATIVPLGTASRQDGSGVDLFGLAVGVQQAVADLGGFCTRAPQACTAAGDVASYAGERIEDGFRLGYGYLTRDGEPADREAKEDAAVASLPAPSVPDPLTTGAVTEFPLPRPYQPPRQAAVAGEETVDATPTAAVATPTPAPRR